MTVPALRRRMSAVRSDAGMSLAELMVSMIVFAILSAMVLSLWVAATKSTTATISSNQNTQAAGNIMSEVSRVIRSGTSNPTTGGTTAAAFVSATADTITMYSYVDANAVTTTPFLVQFSMNGTTGEIIEKRWPAIVGATGLFTFNQTATPSLTRTLPGKITNQSSLFSYYDANGNLLPITGSLTSTQLASVASVTVDAIVQESTMAGATPATLQNTVGLPNLALETN